jgi:hypothetical protein
MKSKMMMGKPEKAAKVVVKTPAKKMKMKMTMKSSKKGY